MTRTLSGLSLALLLTLGLGGMSPSSSATVPSPAAPAPTAKAAKAPKPALKPALRTLLRKVNAARARNDLAPLKHRRCLTRKFSQPWARHMAKTENMVHQPLGPIFTKCPGFHAVAENIAAGYPTAGAVMKGWMNSSGHRQNILNKDYTRIGLGLARSDDGTKYWVQNFGG